MPKYAQTVMKTAPSDVIVHEPADAKRGATADEILAWFGDEQAKVLRFHSLYDAFSDFDKSPLDKKFAEKIKNIKNFAKGNYRQF